MYKKKKILGIIPARISSKRLKQKNIINISSNKNLLHWTYKAIQNSKYLDYTVLSTESSKIQRVAKNIGFKVPFKRPKYLAEDNIDSEEVIEHVLKKLKTNYDYVMLLQPTSPLRNSKDIDKSIKKIIDQNFNSLISISQSSQRKKFNIKLINKKFIKYKFDCYKKKKKYLFLNGAIFLVKTKFFYKFQKPFIWQKRNEATFILMPEARSIDIDTRQDLLEFKNIIKKNRKNY